MGGQAAASDAAMRAPANVAITLVLAAALCALPLIPQVKAILGVEVRDVAVVMAAFAVMMIGGAIAYRHYGAGSVGFAVWDRVETALVQISVLFLVYESGRGDSFFWLLAFVHIMITGNYGTHARYHVALFCTLPVLLALAFVIGRGSWSAALLCLIVGAIGVYIYGMALAVARKLEAADRERARLAAALADRRVLDERTRIARDIHDGIGADLAALDWRLRGLREQLTAAPLQTEVDELALRLTAGTDDLRVVVWALRTEQRSWTELVAYLRQRIGELCGGQLVATITVDGGVEMIDGDQALDFVRGVLELVRNGVRHAGAKALTVSLRASADGLAADIVDDGKGLPAAALGASEGGLANLRHRAERSGGRFVKQEALAGTHLRFVIGMPS